MPQSNSKYREETIQIPTARIGVILGKAAATIRDLKEQSGCDIWIDQERAKREGSELCDVILSGEPTAISKAKRLVNEKLKFGGGSKTIQIPKDRIGAILGKQGATIQELKQRSGCYIWIDLERANHDSSDVCDVVLQGNSAAVALAQHLIDEQLGASHIVYIPVACIGAIFGKQGATIRELNERSGCNIWIDQDRAISDRADVCEVVLRGDPNTFALAQRLIEEEVAKFYQSPDSASDAGTSVSNMSVQSQRSTDHEESAPVPSFEETFPTLGGATTGNAKRASHVPLPTEVAGGLRPISELEQTSSAEVLSQIEIKRREEEKRKLTVRCGKIEMPSCMV